MSNERIIRKIKHCLALSQSSNPDEAATALRQAQKLMQIHNVSEKDTNIIDIKECRASALTKTDPAPWHRSLAAVIADAMGCHFFCGTTKRGYGGHSNFCFIGFDYQPEIAVYAFEVLTRQLVKDRRIFVAGLNPKMKRINKKIRGDNFCTGWVHGVRAVVDAFVLDDDQIEAIEHYKTVNYPDIYSKPNKEIKKYRGSDNDRSLGYALGKNANLHRGTAHQDTVKLESKRG